MPAKLNNWSYWYFDPSMDSGKVKITRSCHITTVSFPIANSLHAQPIIAMYIIQEGVDTVDSVNTQPFLDLGPITSSTSSGTYLDLAKWTGISLEDTPCRKTGNANPRFPIYLKSYNATAQRLAYELFMETTTNASSPFSNALSMFDGYLQGGVKAFPEGATAFACRAENLLVLRC